MVWREMVSWCREVANFEVKCVSRMIVKPEQKADKMELRLLEPLPIDYTANFNKYLQTIKGIFECDRAFVLFDDASLLYCCLIWSRG